MRALEHFHPAVARWFGANLGDPTEAQEAGWSAIREGRHTLIAAPTGSGKTLAAFLFALDRLLREGTALEDETQVLYLSPLKALANDVQKNLAAPLAAIRALDPSLPEVRAVARTGDTHASVRLATKKRPPHVLVTTPESFYVLLGSESGRALLRTVRSVIVDEIHQLARDKRGSHLALSLERLDAIVTAAGRPQVQRIGLSATQKPLADVGHFLVGTDRECALVDAGHLRNLDLAIELPSSPLSAVCSHEVWDEIYEQIAELVRTHRTTLIFVNTRKMAERIAARLGALLGHDDVTCHHGSLSAPRRHDAETRLKEGRLKALVATASLELGIDIGDVDLVVQIGASRSIATLLQRVGRAGHGPSRVPKGRVFPLTRDELVEARALLDAIGEGTLDRTPQPGKPLDILAQQIVASCTEAPQHEDRLFATFQRAWPYRELERSAFDAVVAMHARGRTALLHRDGVGKVLHATKRASLTAITGGGAIPDTADYRVVLEPEGTLVGSLNEDFAIESNRGDVFQLGAASWRIVRIEPGVVRVADAQGAPPSLPFWLGEAPSRSAELARAIVRVREGAAELDTTTRVGSELAEYVASGRKALGVVPTQDDVVIERFFDESGGMQLVLHAPFGGRINRAWGLTLRKRFCRGFGFELQAAATEEAILLSLGEQHSFPLDDVFDYLHPGTARELLVQALLDAPMFKTRWRWNATRSLMLERTRGGKRVPPALLRMRADDLLAASFPAALACPETLPAGDVEIPLDHPLVRQTIDDCLTEAMDIDGFLDVLTRLRDGRIRRHAIDTREPSVFAHGVLAAQPYAFLDDAPLEERRTQAVQRPRALSGLAADDLGALDPEAIRRVREEAWPSPESAEELHEALGWMGFVTEAEASAWGEWVHELRAAGRIVREGDRWFAIEATRDPKEVLRGRFEALGPVIGSELEHDSLVLALEAEGALLRGTFEGQRGFCSRRLLARIHRYTLERLRKEIEPVTAEDFLRFLAVFQHAAPEHRLDGTEGVAEVLRQLAGFEVPAAAWEANVLPLRVRGYKREWLDRLTFSGEFAWGRLWGHGTTAVRNTSLAFVPRDELGLWASLASPFDRSGFIGPSRQILDVLATRGALFPEELARLAGLSVDDRDQGLRELVAAGVVTCDAFGAFRALLRPEVSARGGSVFGGRWSFFRTASAGAGAACPAYGDDDVIRVARQFLRRTGVVFRRTILREKQPIPWRDLLRAFRTLEARGEVRGGRFVAGFDGEQYALPEAVSLLRSIRQKGGGGEPLEVSAADPLNFRGILTPDDRVAATSRGLVRVA